MRYMQDLKEKETKADQYKCRPSRPRQTKTKAVQVNVRPDAGNFVCYFAWILVINDVSIIKQIVDKTGFRWRAEAKKTDDIEEDKDVYKRFYTYIICYITLSKMCTVNCTTAAASSAATTLTTTTATATIKNNNK